MECQYWFLQFTISQCLIKKYDQNKVEGEKVILSYETSFYHKFKVNTCFGLFSLPQCSMQGLLFSKAPQFFIDITQYISEDSYITPARSAELVSLYDLVLTRTNKSETCIYLFEIEFSHLRYSLCMLYTKSAKVLFVSSS